MSAKGTKRLAVFGSKVDEFVCQPVDVAPKVQGGISGSELEDRVGILDGIVCLQGSRLDPSLVERLEPGRRTHEPMDTSIEGEALTNPTCGDSARAVSLLIDSHFETSTTRVEG